MRARLLVLLALGALGAAACGGKGDGPHHGLESRPAPSAPEGAPLVVRHDLVDGAAYVATLSMHTTVYQRGTRDGRTRDENLELRATLELGWTIERPTPGAPFRSRLELRTVDAEGVHAEALRGRPPLHAELQHAADGRPRPDTLHFTDGTKQAQVEAVDLLDSLMLAGFGAAPAWVPPRPVRLHEAFELADTMDLRAAANLRRSAIEQGAEAAAPRLSGSVRLRGVRQEAGSTLLDLELDGLLELEGPLTQEDRTGRVSSGRLSAGNHYSGVATLDAATGVPRSFDVTHTHRWHIRSAGDDYTVGGAAVVRGTVRRVNGPR